MHTIQLVECHNLAAHFAVTSLLQCISIIVLCPECPAGRRKKTDMYWDHIAAFLQQDILINVALICLVIRLNQTCKILLSSAPSQWINSGWNSPPWASRGRSDGSCKDCIRNTGHKAKSSKISYLSLKMMFTDFCLFSELEVYKEKNNLPFRGRCDK